jgi:hypothetical protein
MVRRRNEVEQMNQKLVFVQEGLLSLIRAIDSAEALTQGNDISHPQPGLITMMG